MMASKEMELKCIFVTFLVVVLINVAEIRCDYYTSVAGLEYLLDSEMYLLETYENYMKQVQRTNEQIKEFLKEVEETTKKIQKDPASHYQHPLSAFKAVKRVTVDWKRLEQIVLVDRDGQDFSTNFTKMTALNYANATSDDLIGASKGLARLQKTYELESADIADGILMGYQYDESVLSAHDCFDIGRNLYGAGDFVYSSKWLLQAHRLFHIEMEESEDQDEKITPDFPHLSEIDILEFLAPSMFNIGNFKMAKIFNDDLLKLDSTNQYALQNQKLFETNLIAERNLYADVNSLQPKLPETSKVDELTEAVCRGSVHQTPAEQRKLRCRYTSKNVPFLRLAPFKMEELSHDPFVALYHDAIYENEMQKIINATEDQVERSKVGDLKNSAFSEIRTSKNTWLYYEQHSFLDAIKQRLMDITGLTLDSAEPLQVVNYGIGGHYGAHYDFSEDPDDTYQGQGNRILTALYYINDVELGGATAFPFLHLAVPPIKGSLVVWFNMHGSLELDYRTKHAGCPVLKGSKWVCNEWFHQVGQEFVRPCSLERNGEISLPFRDLY